MSGAHTDAATSGKRTVFISFTIPHPQVLKVQSERIERIARGRQDVLAPVEHVGFHGIRYLAEVGMP